MSERLEPLIAAEQISERVGELARQIEKDHRGAKLTLVIVLKGATVFAADLMRQIGIPFVIDFISASSYRDSIRSSGHVLIRDSSGLDVRGHHVILIEDIVDTGLTINTVLAELRGRGRKASMSAPCSTNGSPGLSRSKSATRGSTSPTCLSSATVWITPNATAICPAFAG